MQKERPILFSTDMVIATLEGRKTKTRRTRGLDLINENPNDYKPYDRVCSFASGDEYGMGFIHKKTKENIVVKSPYGYKGDLLWVKETWNCISHLNPDNTEYEYYYKTDAGNEFQRWKSSRFMPKEAARIWLEVLEVKVERLHEISEEDAIAEGVEVIEQGESYKDYLGKVDWYGCAVNSFKSLWIKINGEESWNENVWVWVLSFKVLSTTGKKNKSNEKMLHL